MKKQLAEDMIRFITPIRESTLSMLEDQKTLVEIMKKGASKARKSAAATMKLVQEFMGLNYF